MVRTFLDFQVTSLMIRFGIVALLVLDIINGERVNWLSDLA
jgi:hypothetical protein